MPASFVAIRSALSFVTLLILARLMGKKEIRQLTAFDYVTGIAIGSVAASLSIDDGLPVINGLVSLVVWSGLTILVGLADLWSIKSRKLTDGEPTVIIQNGKILENNMAKMRYNMEELLMQLRNKGAFDPAEVEFAVMEPNGRLSVLKKSQYLPLTPHDVGLSTQYRGVVSELVVDGDIIGQNLKQNHLTREWLFDQLKSRGIDDIKKVMLATLATDGTLYVDLKKDPGYLQRAEDEEPPERH